LVTFPHVIAAAWMSGGAFMLGIALWQLWRSATPQSDTPMYRKAARLGAVAVLAGGLATAVTGDVQGKIITEVQPMKMAAAEALYETSPQGEGAPFSIITVGTPDGLEERWAVTVPKLLSYLATGTLDGEVKGIDDLQDEYELAYSDDALTVADNYRPVIPVTYWSFRWMIGTGMAAAGIALLALWMLRGERRLEHRAWAWVSVAVILLPVAANSFGWIFTEMGRQPWLVFGVMTTATGVSPGTTAWEVGLSLATLTLLYGVLAVVEVGLIVRYGRAGAEPAPTESLDPSQRDDDQPFVFSY
ncbi:MAG: cytochrome ubiquinol oxidase subunit I, partial [Ornithinimicrobium sp.]